MSKNILYITHEPFWPLGGGGTAGTYHVVNCLAQQGFKITVFSPLNCPVSEVPWHSQIQLNPFTPFSLHRNVRFRTLKYIIYSLLAFFPLRRLIQANSFDAVITHNTVMALPVIFLRKRIQALKALRYTDFLSEFLMLRKGLWNITARIMKKYEISVAKYFDQILVVTNAMKNELVREGRISSEKIKVIYDGVDTGAFNPRSFLPQDSAMTRKAMGIPRDAKVVLFHGTLELHHPIDQIARIVKLVCQREPSVYFVFIGMGRAWELLKAKVQTSQTIFLNQVSYPEISRYIQAADVGIIPYPKQKAYDKILTLKLLEYLSLGLPCVSFDLNGIKEVFGQYNFVKFSSTELEFVDNIFMQLSSKKSKDAQRLIASFFSWEAVAARIASVLLKEESFQREASTFQLSSV